MAIEIADFKQARKRLGLTQSELASRAGVSQSLIAKVEAGRLDPTYTNARRIIEVLESLSHKKEAKAADIMTRKIVSVSPDEGISEAIEKMRKFKISQLPVVHEGRSVGLVSESTLLQALLDKKGRKIRNIMEDSPPVVSENTALSAVSDLLKFFPVVLISKDGELVGLITKSDILEKFFEK